MAIDLRRIALAAVEAAVNEQREAPQQQKQKKRGLGAGRALLLGAGLVTVGRAAMRARGSGLLESAQQRLADLEDELGIGSAREAEDGDYEGEEDFVDEDREEPEDYEEEEPEDYEEEEPEDYEEEEPEDYEEEPEDYEEEPEDYEEEEERRRPSRVKSGTATKRRRRGWSDGDSRDGTA